MSLIAWYPFNGDAKDYSGNNNHIVSGTYTEDVKGKIGKCFVAGGTFETVLKTPITTNKLSNNVTISFWIFNTKQTGSIAIFGNKGNDSNTSATSPERTFNYFLYPTPTDFHYSCSKYSGVLKDVVPYNQWTHITTVQTSKQFIIYINGIKKQTIAISNPTPKNNYALYIGGGDNGNSTCKFNDVRIYNEALSTKQIKEIAQAKMCHYTFNEELYENTVNLYNNKNQIGSNGPKIEWENTYAFKFEIQENTTYAGAAFNSNLTLKPLTTYTLSYKLKKIEGSLTQIRGHVEGNYFDLLSTKLNGKENYYHYHNGIELNDSFDTHYIEVTFRTKEDVTSMNKIYIQPNAKKNEYVKVRVWDIQVEEKDHSTPFISGTRLHKLKDISGFGYDMVSSLNVPPVWKNDEDKSYIHLDDKAYYYLTNSSLIDLKEFTYSCWIRTTNTTAFAVLGAPTGNNSNHSLAIRNGKICLHSYFHTPGDAKADRDYAIGTTNVADGQWHLATITYNDVTVKTYVDGKLEAQTNLTMNFARKESDRFGFNINNESNLGQYEDRRFIGDIRDARVYATALSAEDIKLLYQPEISIDKANVIRCSEINEEKIENKNGFSKDASITYNEFNEIPNIESGVHNLRLGNEILPVLIDMDNDGGRWARVFYHNCKSGTVLFSRDNSFAEAKETNINAPTTSDKYSILSKLENFRPNTNSSFEFKLKYPTDTNGSNIWKQTSNPTHQKVTGYKSIKIDWTSNYWGGLEWTNGSTTLINGSANHGNWYYAIGAASKHGDGIPSCTNVNNNGTTTNDVELWVRINNYDLFVDSFIDNVSISRNGILTAKEFREI